MSRILTALPLILLTSCAPLTQTTVNFTRGEAILVYEDTRQPIQFRGLPRIAATVNGQRGYFLIDTGADGPIITESCVERCGIKIEEGKPEDATMNLGGTIVATQVAKNVTVQFHSDLSITWSRAVIFRGGPFGREFFGIIDYNTLRATNAVIDIPSRTITVRSAPR